MRIESIVLRLVFGRQSQSAEEQETHLEQCAWQFLAAIVSRLAGGIR